MSESLSVLPGTEGGGRGLAAKEQEGIFRDDRNVSSPTCSGFMGTYICQNSLNCPFEGKIYLEKLPFEVFLVNACNLLYKQPLYSQE